MGVAALFYKKERPLQRGDEVIVPAISWATTYHPLQQYGLKLKFVDVELDTLNVDPRQLAEAIGPRTRMIMAVSILGNPAALDVMRRLCDRHGLYLFEDNCESMDAELANRKAGTFGAVNTFSFFFSHHISTMEGGMVLTDDEETVASVQEHSRPWLDARPAQGLAAVRAAQQRPLRGLPLHPAGLQRAPPGDERRHRPRAAQEAAGLHGQRGATTWALFQRLFRGDNRFIIPRENGKSSSFCFPIVLNPDLQADREKVFAALHDADIGFRIITGGNFLRHDVIRYFDYEIHGGAAPNADTAHDNGFFVGNHPFDLSSQIEKLYRVLDKSC